MLKKKALGMAVSALFLAPTFGLAATHSNSFKMYIYDYDGDSPITGNKLTKFMSIPKCDGWSATNGQRGEAEPANSTIYGETGACTGSLDNNKPGCFLLDSDGNPTDYIHCEWEVGRQGSPYVSKWFDEKIGDDYSAVISGSNNGDFVPAKQSSKMNFAWSGKIDFSVYDDQYCTGDYDPNSRVPVKEYYLNYTLGQSGENFGQIALSDMEHITVNALKDAMCDAIFSGTASNEAGEDFCNISSISDWAGVVYSTAEAFENPWFMGLQTLSGNESPNISKHLSAGYMNGTFKPSNSDKTSSAVVARLVEIKDGKEMPLHRENTKDHIGDFLVYGTTHEKGMTSMHLYLSERLTKYAYDGKGLTCGQLLDKVKPAQPTGQYTDVCKDIKWDGETLSADCDTGHLTLDYYENCKHGSEVQRYKDNLQCIDPLEADLPLGSYVNSCSDIQWQPSEGVLQGNCKDSSGDEHPGILYYYSYCQPGSTVSNDEGALKCDTPK